MMTLTRVPWSEGPVVYCVLLGSNGDPLWVLRPWVMLAADVDVVVRVCDVPESAAFSNIFADHCPVSHLTVAFMPGSHL